MSFVMPPYVYNRDIEPGKDLIHYSGPVWDELEIQAGIQAFTQGKWLNSGVNVARFEKEFSKMFGHKESLMVNSGSSANLVMLAALKKHFGWISGDEIIVSVVGFPTTVAPILQNGLWPSFVDIELNSLNFDLNKIEAKIKHNTKAIFISPVLGSPPDMERLLDLAKLKGIKLILDGCDSLGSKYHGKHLSDFAVASSCSFYPAHHLTTGEGGMVSSNEPEIVKLARKFAWWGRDCYCIGQANFSKDGTCGKRFDNHLGLDIGVCDHKYVFSEIGYNLKPLDFQGAIGLVQLAKFQGIHEGRRKVKEHLHWAINRIKGPFKVLGELPQAETSWFGVPIICDNQHTKTRLVNHLEKSKIQTRNYFAGNLLRHPGYAHLSQASDFPNADEVLKRVFFIGCHPVYSERVLNYIEDAFVGFWS